MSRLTRLYAQPPRVLLVHPDDGVRRVLEVALSRRGWSVASSREPPSVRDGEGRVDGDTVVLGGARTEATCENLTRQRPDVPVVLLAHDMASADARRALRAGAAELVRADDPDTVARAVARALWRRGLERALRQPLPVGEATDPADALIGRSPAMRRARTWLRTIARSSGTVIITGETGTGKELAARTLHECSGRREGAFVTVNCAAIPPHLMESMLFGHARGAFTDARDARLGLLQQASGGTLLLDEIVCLPLSLQAKLLRALESRTIRPVGGQGEQPFDVRVLVATQRPLDGEVRAERFRSDLYYRLAVFELRLPPLREREGDVVLLARWFLRRAAERMGKPVRGLTPEAARRLLEHDWPGNVRELQNRIEAAVALASCDHLRGRDLPRLPAERPEEDGGGEAGALFSLHALEDAYIHYTCDQTAGNKSETARILGIDRKTVQRHGGGHPEADQRALRWIRAAMRRVSA